MSNTSQAMQIEEVAQQAQLMTMLRAELKLTYEFEQRAEFALEESVGESLKRQVENYPLIICLYYRAANEADDNLLKTNRRMERIERDCRGVVAEREKDGTYEKLNEQKRADKLSELLDEHETYQALLLLADDAARDKRNFVLEGDQLRRELYSLRQEREREIRSELLQYEMAQRALLIEREYDRRCNAAEFERNARLDVLQSARAGD